jgi:proteic killer suppression protein
VGSSIGPSQQEDRLHAVIAARKGQWSISVNDQFRICFFWTEHGPDEVEFVDYH